MKFIWSIPLNRCVFMIAVATVTPTFAKTSVWDLKLPHPVYVEGNAKEVVQKVEDITRKLDPDGIGVHIVVEGWENNAEKYQGMTPAEWTVRDMVLAIAECKNLKAFFLLDTCILARSYACIESVTVLLYCDDAETGKPLSKISVRPPSAGMVPILAKIDDFSTLCVCPYWTSLFDAGECLVKKAERNCLLLEVFAEGYLSETLELPCYFQYPWNLGVPIAYIHFHKSLPTENYGKTKETSPEGAKSSLAEVP